MVIYEAAPTPCWYWNRLVSWCTRAFCGKNKAVKKDLNNGRLQRDKTTHLGLWLHLRFSQPHPSLRKLLPLPQKLSNHPLLWAGRWGGVSQLNYQHFCRNANLWLWQGSAFPSTTLTPTPHPNSFVLDLSKLTRHETERGYNLRELDPGSISSWISLMGFSQQWMSQKHSRWFQGGKGRLVIKPHASGRLTNREQRARKENKAKRQETKVPP